MVDLKQGMPGWMRPLANEAAVYIDGICKRRNVSLSQLANEVGCSHSYLSRLRDGTRMPSRDWFELFVADCALTDEEALRGFEMFGFVPAGYRLVKDAA